MVLVDSRRIPRAPRYSGTNQTHVSVLTIYATITPYGRPSQAIQLNTNTQAHSRQKALTGLPHNTTHTNPRRGHTRTRFSHHPLSLATTHRISSPMGTKMFQFPTFPPNNYYKTSLSGSKTQTLLGYPIRKPPDQHLLVNSPRNIADRHVLHQLSTPRHPPNAPTKLKTKSHKNKDANNHYTKNQQPTPNTTNNPPRPTQKINPKGLVSVYMC